MSQPQISRSDDLRRLTADGYNISIRSALLVCEDIPYVDANRRVRLGILACPLNVNADGITLPPENHVMQFGGDFPCDQHGNALSKIEHGHNRQQIAPGLFIDHSFSSKPKATGRYADYYEKVSTYAAILSGPAHALDSTTTPRVFRTANTEDDRSPFNYADTASSRAGITAASHRLAMERVAIVGLGGTGSYVLDLVAKTPVAEIHLFDEDVLHVHNAFRAPGAASVEELRAEPNKVHYLAQCYSPMRRGIVPSCVH